MDFSEVKRLIDLSVYEDQLYEYGFENIAGVDEAGRGSLAGPIVAAAVILDKKKRIIENLNDSKKLDFVNRKKVFRNIIKTCKSWSFATVSNTVIDRISMGKANILVLKKAIKYLKIVPDIVISDAIDINLNKTAIDIIPLIKGDEKSSSVAAASIIAKVIRDSIMVRLSRINPEYDFKTNKGYGTKKHQIFLQKYGPSRFHRISFKGVLY